METAELERHRPAITGHCYRMLGSVVEADDAVQETMVKAWRALDRFEGRASVRTWLTRIATNVCLDAIGDRTRRARPMELGPSGWNGEELTALPHNRWIEPIPDAHAIPGDVDPAERAMLRESIRLAFVAALQHLPPKQRAALLLADVLGWPAAEIAETLATSVAAVNSALQRARATLAERDLRARGPLTPEQSSLLARYVDAFERYDVDALTALLVEDATMSMPPFALWLRGQADIARWFLGPGSHCRGSELVPLEACGMPAFGQYRTTGPWAVIVLDITDRGIVDIATFLDVGTLFPRFGLPAER